MQQPRTTAIGRRPYQIFGSPICPNPNQPAVLRYRDSTVNCPTLGEVVVAWHRLDAGENYTATITAQDGKRCTGAEIDMLYAAPVAQAGG